MARISITVDDAVLTTWRECAEVQGSSLSGLVAEWMTELEPGLAEVVRLGHAMRHATEAQRAALRDAVTAAEAAVQPALVSGWGELVQVVDQAERDHGNPRTSNRGVR